MFFEFYPDSCFVKCQVSKQVLLNGVLSRDGLYYFDQIHLLKSSPPSVPSTLVPSPSSASNKNGVLNTSGMFNRLISIMPFLVGICLRKFIWFHHPVLLMRIRSLFASSIVHSIGSSKPLAHGMKDSLLHFYNLGFSQVVVVVLFIYFYLWL